MNITYIYDICVFPLILNIPKPSKTMVLRYAGITHLGPKQWGCYDWGWDVIHEPQRLWKKWGGTNEVSYYHTLSLLGENPDN